MSPFPFVQQPLPISINVKNGSSKTVDAVKLDVYQVNPHHTHNHVLPTPQAASRARAFPFGRVAQDSVAALAQLVHLGATGREASPPALRAVHNARAQCTPPARTRL